MGWFAEDEEPQGGDDEHDEDGDDDADGNLPGEGKATAVLQCWGGGWAGGWGVGGRWG